MNRCYLESKDLAEEILRGAELHPHTKEVLIRTIKVQSKYLWNNLSWTLPWAPPLSNANACPPAGLLKELHEFQAANLAW